MSWGCGIGSQVPTCSLFPVLPFPRRPSDTLALFFYDQHGGEVIGVLWKPAAGPAPSKVSWLVTVVCS